MEEIKIRRRNTFKLIVSLLLIFQMLLPMELVYAVEGIRSSGNDIFKEPVISLNGEEISADRPTNVKIADEIHVSYDWTLPDGFDTSEELRIQPIPSNIKAFKDLESREINIIDEGEVIGSFQFLEAEIRVKFKEDFQVLEEKHGNLEFKFKLSEDDFKDDNIINLDFGKDYPIRLEPGAEGGEIEKTGKLSEDGKSIHWEVELNKNYMDLGQVTIKDPIPEGLKLDGKVELYKMNKKGDIVGGPESYEAFPIELDNLVRPHKLTYSTKIEDGFSTKKDFINSINIKSQGLDKSSEALVEVNTRDNIEKTGKKVTIDSKNYIEWTLKVNKSELDYENLIIDDVFGNEADQELVEDSIKIEPESPLKKLDKKDGGFSLELGKTDKTHSISYRTELKNLKMEPGQSQKISNKLKVRDGDKENTEIEKEASVDYHREKLVEKYGSVEIDYENKEKYISWEVLVNKAGEELVQGTIIKDQDIKLEDQEVLELKEDSLKLLDSKGEELVESKDYELVKNSQGLWEIKLLRDFNESIKIKYGTLTVPNSEYYGNKVAIDLAGNGIIDDYEESSVDARSFNDKIYKELPDYDFENKTASWEVKLYSESGNFSSVFIEDVMTENLSYTDSSMEIDLDGVKLLESSDYILGFNEAGNLTIELTDKGLDKADKGKNSVLTLLYKTDFNPDVLEENSYIKNTAYAKFKTEKDPEERELDDWIEKHFEDWIRENAKKEARMDQENRSISWQVYLNPQEAKNASLNYKDILGPGQEYRKESLRLYKYSFKGQSSQPIKGQLLEEGEDYSLEFSQDGKSFDLSLMEKGERIILEYETKIIGRSQEYYENTIRPTDPGMDQEYKAEVYFEDWDKFLDKKARFEVDSVYPQDELSWELEINRSYSELKDVKIIDTLAGGHEYLEDSLRVVDSKGKDYKDYRLEVRDGKLIIDLGDIDSFYKISYSSFVTADAEDVRELSNIAQLESGDEVITRDDEFESVEINSIGAGVGTGVLRGSLELIKVDQDKKAIENNPAEFKLYKILSNGKRIEIKNPNAFTDDEYLFRTDESGLLKIERLAAASYILVETKAPEGYSLSEEGIEFEISRDKRVFKKEFINEKEKYGYLSIEKVDSKDKELFLEGAEFEVLNSRGEKVGKLVTDQYGRASIKLSPAAYKLRELKAPEGYKLKEEALEIEISEDLTTSLSVENEKLEELEPEEPGKDPEEPGKDPEEPEKDPEEPGKDPEEPGKDPEEAGKDPEEAAGQLPKTGLANTRAYSILGVLLLICSLYIIKKSKIS